MNNELIVLVKKYFDKANGNTYHSVQFEINDNIYHSGKTYGYERQYEQTFKNLLLDVAKKKNPSDISWWGDLEEKMKDTKYIVIENCKAKELKEIHEYK